MPPLKQSIAWWCFVPDLLSPKELLRAAVEIGYEAIAGLKAAFEIYTQRSLK
jgi:hypothetical protein